MRGKAAKDVEKDEPVFEIGYVARQMREHKLKKLREAGVEPPEPPVTVRKRISTGGAGGEGRSSKARKSAASSSTTAASSQDRAKREVVIQGFETKSKLSRPIAEELEEGILQVACPNGQSLADKDAYKEYGRQYKRLCTHFRQNASLVQQLQSGELEARSVASLSDSVLLTSKQRSEREKHEQEGMQEALASSAAQTAHWVPSTNYSCPKCDCTECVYIELFRGYHQYDESYQAVSTIIRCTACEYLWKEEEVEGGRAAAGSFAEEKQAEEKSAEDPEIWKRSGDKERSGAAWLVPASSL